MYLLAGACPEEDRCLSQACNIKFAREEYIGYLLVAEGNRVRCLDE